MSKKALTLLEIIISMVILALVITGLASVFVASKAHIKHSRYRMGGGEIGKMFLDPLQAYIREDSWSTNCFATGAIADCPQVTASTGVYTTTYSFNNHTTDPDIKRVKVQINWAE